MVMYTICYYMCVYTYIGNYVNKKDQMLLVVLGSFWGVVIRNTYLVVFSSGAKIC